MPLSVEVAALDVLNRAGWRPVDPGRGGRLVYRPGPACRRLPVLAVSGGEEIEPRQGLGVPAGLEDQPRICRNCSATSARCCLLDVLRTPSIGSGISASRRARSAATMFGPGRTPRFRPRRGTAGPGVAPCGPRLAPVELRDDRQARRPRPARSVSATRSHGRWMRSILGRPKPCSARVRRVAASIWWPHQSQSPTYSTRCPACKRRRDLRSPGSRAPARWSAAMGQA